MAICLEIQLYLMLRMWILRCRCGNLEGLTSKLLLCARDQEEAVICTDTFAPFLSREFYSEIIRQLVIMKARSMVSDAML